MKDFVIGVDLGGTKILSAIVSKRGKILKRSLIPTEACQGPSRVIENIKRSIYELLDSVPLSKIEAIGIGAPGPVLYSEGIILNPPNLPGWRKVPLQRLIGNEFKKKVILENDANAAAIGEATFGVAKGIKNFIYMTVSTGIGGGIILNGKLYKGSIGGAGEVGHMIIKTDGEGCGCGNRGCLEAMASGRAMARRAKAEAKNNSVMLLLAGGRRDKINAKTIEDAAKLGDKLAKEIIKDTAFYLGVGLANLINILAPDMIVLGGGVMKMGKPFLHEVERTARAHSLPPAGEHVKIAHVKLGEDAGVLGAAALCLT
jgi:glucokinase